jgi:GH25 family lysozyme M1 (1,4-beta-N-acetylmuramidase)
VTEVKTKKQTAKKNTGVKNSEFRNTELKPIPTNLFDNRSVIIATCALGAVLLMLVGLVLFQKYRKWNKPAYPVQKTGGSIQNYISETDERIPVSEVDTAMFEIDGNGYKVYMENGTKTSLTGIDVSKWNGNVDWKRVKNAGVDYAMIRLGHRASISGEIAEDPMFRENIEGAAAAGLKVGVYFYTQAVNLEEAREEAEFCIDRLAGYELSFPVAFDTERAGENGRANNLDNALRTEIAKTFMERVKEAGFKPAIYMNTSWSLTSIDLQDLTDYDLWYAFYGEDLYYPYRFTMWQYSDKGSVPGVKGHVDLNISFVDY